MKRWPVAAVLFVLFLGCGSSKESASDFVQSKAPQEGAFGAPLFSSTRQNAARAAVTIQQPVGVAPFNALPFAKNRAPVDRKIIYNGSIELVVADLSEAATKLEDLVKQVHGLVAQSQTDSDPGAPRMGNWRVRIPVDKFRDFVNQIAKLGESRKKTTDSEDITEQFFDYEVRIENKKIQVERLQKIIKEQTGKIADLLESERELGRVTTELEQMKGTVKVWENQVALATVNITLHERKGYTPPESPTFSRNVANTFSGSVEAVSLFAQTLALIAVALTPWLPVIAIVGVPLWLVIRRARRQPAVSTTGAQEPQRG